MNGTMNQTNITEFSVKITTCFNFQTLLLAQLNKWWYTERCMLGSKIHTVGLQGEQNYKRTHFARFVISFKRL